MTALYSIASAVLFGVIVAAGLLAMIVGAVVFLVWALIWVVTRPSAEEVYEAEAFGDVPHISADVGVRIPHGEARP